jgi:general secretion pathway protein C
MTPPSAMADRFRRLVAPGRPGDARSAFGPQLALLLAVVLLGGQLAVLLWQLLPGAGRGPAAGVRLAPPPATADENALARAHLFGAAEVAGNAGAEAQATRVPLILAGTLAVRDPTQGLAIVGATAQAGKLYAVGSVLPGGVKLHEVYADHIVLEHDGVLETLSLPRQFTGGVGPASAALSPGGNSGEPPLADSVQKLIAQGPEVIGEVLRPMPTYANGQLKGFRVYPGRNRAKFEMLQLRAGDLVTQINNVPLSDPQRGMEILRTLGTSGAAQVTVERGAVTQQLMIDAAQVAGLAQPNSDAPGPPAGAPPAPNPE